jgi:ADP-ribose pyrophosphatase
MLKQQQAHPQYPARGTQTEPVYFTSPIVVKNIRTSKNPQGWADPFWCDMTDTEKNVFISSFNYLNLSPTYLVPSHKDYGYNGPINPAGRTGMIGRGLLGKYGPNYAADPIVTRFKNGVLEMAAISRDDVHQWAIPGGMVERGDTVSKTLLKEFSEEALGDSLYGRDNNDPEYVSKIDQVRKDIEKLFSNGTTVYKGWVDDPRNTDWAWMETTAVHFHIEDDSVLHDIELRPASDAEGVKWYKLDSIEAFDKLYASHGTMVQKAIRKMAEKDKWSALDRLLENNS